MPEDFLAAAERELQTWRASKPAQPPNVNTPVITPVKAPPTRASTIAAWRIERASQRRLSFANGAAPSAASPRTALRHQINRLADARTRRIELYNEEVEMSQRLTMEQNEATAATFTSTA